MGVQAYDAEESYATRRWIAGARTWGAAARFSYAFTGKTLYATSMGSMRAAVVFLGLAFLLCGGCSSGSVKHAEPIVGKTTSPRPSGGAQTRSEKPPSPEPTAQTPPGPSAEQIAIAEKEYRLGVAAFEQSDYPRAIEHLDLVHKTLPDHMDAAKYLIEANLFVGMEHYTAGDLDGALHVWRRILEIDPGHDRALHFVRETEAELEKMKQLSGEGED